MSLITCPKCGKTISEKAITCPHCKFNLSQQNLIVCDECGREYEMKFSACPNCGFPNSTIEKKKQKKKHKGIIISTVVIALIVISVLGFSISQRAKEAEYYSNMESVSYTMLDGAAKAEDAGNLIKSVWYNAIYEERDTETDKYAMKNGKFVYDFNDALSNLFADESFDNSISEIELNQSEVTDLMKKLKNPPKKYEEAYAVLKTYYDNYMKMTKSVISPTGSLQTFSEDFNTYDSDTVNSFEKMKLYLD
uniref:zinc ribbon domain-containing protein n=1 Tax=Eubacterium sp. TaxID=142586 RepID=UPI003FEDBAFE